MKIFHSLITELSLQLNLSFNADIGGIVEPEVEQKMLIYLLHHIANHAQRASVHSVQSMRKLL